MNKNKEAEFHRRYLMKKVMDASQHSDSKHFASAVIEYTTWIDDNGRQHKQKVKKPKTEYIDLSKL